MRAVETDRIVTTVCLNFVMMIFRLPVGFDGAVVWLLLIRTFVYLCSQGLALPILRLSFRRFNGNPAASVPVGRAGY